jgi:hypothetical protein
MAQNSWFEEKVVVKTEKLVHSVAELGDWNFTPVLF